MQAKNLPELCEALNELERRYLADDGSSFVINRGVSTPEEQARIDPAHPNDAHVKGSGVDIDDPDHRLYQWLESHLEVLEELELWMESKVTAPNHVHLQKYPPKSGHRIFIA